MYRRNLSGSLAAGNFLSDFYNSTLVIIVVTCWRSRVRQFIRGVGETRIKN
ncbi:MAG: hypothetical protein MUD14_03645 [Hydrococcus sp. Prado102]|nr:hypothetical protein [Hydrococcus sp. Prado102]